MYQSASYASPPSGYTSPPPAADPYRAAPISVNSRQPYSFSPPNSNGYSRGPPAPNARYAPQISRSPHHQASRQSAYPTPPGRGTFPQQASQLPPARHKGTLAPGQVVTVGDVSVRIEKYLSEGGYAHVYLTTSDKPVYSPNRSGQRGQGYTQQCLKRIAFRNEKHWVDVKKEIEVMKALPPNPYLVQYLGSAHDTLPDGTHEVFILMEFAAGGGIIDLLNRRLRDRLKEIEILNIFTDVCEAVAAMHALSKPLVHRDLKIENVLAAPSNKPSCPQRPAPFTFKLCDFGSTTYPAARPPSSKLEADALALDLDAHTTLQYRSPEMVEPMLGLAVGLPSDVWALGVLLYKLCYYTTPFEDHGPLAIVNAKYTFPQYPGYSPRMQHLIASMLVEQPIRRPTVFEVLKVAHEMSGTKPLIDYPTPSRSISPTTQLKSPPPQQHNQSANLLDFTSSSSDSASNLSQPALMPSIQPQRRGRPTKEPSQTSVQTIGKLPVPPAMSPHPSMSSAPTLQQVSSSASITQSRSSPGSARQQPVGKVQVTGEGRSDSKASSTDAFGVPSTGTTNRAGSGFSDSFALPRKGSDSKQSSARFGFSDSFSSKAPSPLSPKPAFPTTFGAPKTGSPPKLARSASSSIPDGEVRFETRFPSIESLDATSPTAEAPPRTASHLISPIDLDSSRPRPSHRMPSMIGNMTGGDLSPAQKSHRLDQSAPLPRSTHVTGTAFKHDDGMLSPLGSDAYTPLVDDSDTKDYFQRDKSSVPSSPMPPDLMTGHGDTMGDMPTSMATSRPSPREPLVSPRPESRPAQQIPPTTGHSRPLLPQLNSAKPRSNFESDRWSPLEDMQRASKQDSSDEDEGPESASANRPLRRPSPERQGSQQDAASRSVTDRAAMFSGERRGSSPTKDGERDPSPTKSRSVPLLDTQKQRPSSMMPLSPGSSDVNLPAPSQGRPGHSRKGSINDIVSRYETMHVMSPGASPTEPKMSTGARPNVAAKPPALRQMSSSNAPTSPISPKADKTQSPMASPVKPKPVKPSSKPDLLKRDTATDAKAAESKPKERPPIKPKPSVRADSASTRLEPPREIPSTNGSKPDVKAHGKTSTIPKLRSPGPQTSASGKSSPEKQQSVNSLIAKWNSQRM